MKRLITIIFICHCAIAGAKVVPGIFASASAQAVTHTSPVYESETHGYATTNSSIVLNKPTGTASGELLVAIINVNTNLTITAPSGWVNMATANSSSSGTYAVYYKVTGGSEGSTYTWSWTGNQRNSGAILRFSGSYASDPTNATISTLQTSPSTTAVANSITLAAKNSVVVYLCGYDQASGNTWGGGTGYTGVTPNDGSITSYAAYQIFTATGATGATDHTLTNTPNSTYRTAFLCSFVRND